MSQPAGKCSPIDILVLSPSADHTQELVTSLRNAGVAVHPRRLHDLDRLREALEQEVGDLLLVCAYEPGVDMEAALAMLADFPHAPATIVLCGAKTSPEALFAAMRNGARDLVARDDTTHLQLVVLREFGDLETRRQLERLRQRLAEAEARCLGLVERSREAIAFVQDGMYISVNQAYQELFGATERTDLEDMPVLDSIDPGEHTRLKTLFKSLERIPEGEEVEMEFLIRKVDGDRLKLPLQFNRTQFDGHPGIQIVARPTAASTAVPAESATQAAGARTPEPGQRPLISPERLTAEIERRIAHPSSRLDALMLIQLRGLAQDGEGDIRQAFENFAAPLDAIAEESGHIAWFGPDSIALLLDRATANEVEEAAQEIIECLHDKSPSSDSGSFEVFIGCELITGGDAHSVLKHAHEALSEADNAHPIRIYRPPVARTPQPEDAADPQVRLIDEALTNDRLQLMFQPIVSLQGDTRENYSVLVRLQDRNGNLLLPELFLPDAERSGRMLQIDRWVIRHAIQELAQHREEGKKVNFFITLSRDSILEPETLIWVCDCLREFHARGGWITFQIDQVLARELAKPAQRLIEGLKKIKCQIALDHFGLEPGGEALLQQLPVDFARLSPDFTQGLPGDQQKQDRLAQINELIQKEGAKTVATGVEDANCLTVLWTVGIGYIQGFFLQEPSSTIEYGIESL